jgi:RimJ/RimL family protein N-acetyltransferase
MMKLLLSLRQTSAVSSFGAMASSFATMRTRTAASEALVESTCYSTMRTMTKHSSTCFNSSIVHSKSNTRLFSVSAYSGIPSDGKSGTENLTLPLQAKLPNPHGGTPDRLVEVDTFQTTQEIGIGRRLMNDVIMEGKAWPFEPIFETNKDFQGYFLSHAAFVVRSLENQNAILGCFYIKPNYPGRCSHIANGGFIVDPQYRGSRVGTLMGACFKRWAKDLGYKAAYFNLVFASNQVSIRLWERLGFQRVAVIPKCARLEGMPIDPDTGEPVLDTAYGYHVDLDALPEDYDPLEETGFQP